MPRVDMCTITTAMEIGSVNRRRSLQTGIYLDPARILFPDHAHVMELQGRRRYHHHRHHGCPRSTTFPSTTNTSSTISSTSSSSSSSSNSSTRSSTEPTLPLSLTRVTSAPVIVVALGTTVPSTLIMARPPPHQTRRAQTESAPPQHQNRRQYYHHSSSNHTQTTTNPHTFPPVPLTVVHPKTAAAAAAAAAPQYHRRVATADSMAMSSVSHTSATVTSIKTTPIMRPYHNVYHTYHRRNSSAPITISASMSQNGSVRGGSVVTAGTNSAVMHASLLGTRPKRTLFPKEETIVLTLEGYCARESKQTIIPLSRAESVVCGATGQNCPSITAKEYKRQVRCDQRDIRRKKHLEFIPKPSLWSGEVRHYRKQALKWRYQWTRKGRNHLASMDPKPIVSRNGQGCLC